MPNTFEYLSLTKAIFPPIKPNAFQHLSLTKAIFPPIKPNAFQHLSLTKAVILLVTLADKARERTLGILGTEVKQLADSVRLDLLHQQVDDGRGVGVHEARALRSDRVGEEAAHLLQGVLYGWLMGHTHNGHVTTRHTEGVCLTHNGRVTTRHTEGICLTHNGHVTTRHTEGMYLTHTKWACHNT